MKQLLYVVMLSLFALFTVTCCGDKGATFHHNLLAHHDSRNPRFCGSRYSKQPDKEKIDFRNNVIYNWGGNSGYAGEGGSYNMVNNYYKAGSGSANKNRIFSPSGQDQTQSSQQPGNVWGKFWLSGNYVDGYPAVTSDNWIGLQPNPSNGSPLPGGSVENIKLTAAFEAEPVTTQTAEEAYNDVLTKAGASLKRDNTDARVTNEVRLGLAPERAYYSVEPLKPLPGGVSSRTRAGMIDSQADVGGWNTYSFDPADVPAYSETDGIPLTWMQANGLSAGDGTKIAANGYTNLENYINSLVQ